MKDFLKAVMWLMLTIILGLSIALSIRYAGAKKDEQKYNGGICTECGGHYIYQQAIGHQVDTDYIYICDKCGSMIELDKYIVERKEE